jgi:hypothetical protein
MTVDAQPETFLVRVLSMQAPAGGKMNDFIEQRDEDQFANGQSCRDLRVSPDLTQPGFELMEAINSISDFFRFVRISAREIALNHRKSFKNGRQHPGASGRRTRRCQRTVELLGGGGTEAGQLCL